MFMNHTTAFADTATTATPVTLTDIPELAPAERLKSAATLVAGTMVETQSGWRPARDLRLGDSVYTFDGGLKPIATLTPRLLTRKAEAVWQVPTGALGNDDVMRLSDGQHVLIENRACGALFDAQCVLAPISAMRGFRGIKPISTFARTHGVNVTFETTEIIYAQTGALLKCDATCGRNDDFYQTLDYGQTRALLQLMDPAQCDVDAARFAA